MAVKRLLAVLCLISAPVFAQKVQDMIRELQRDIATLQQDTKTLNSKFDEKMAVMNTLLQQALDEAKGGNKGVAVLDRQLKDSLKEMQSLIAAPVATLNSRVDSLGTDMSALSESVKELSSRIGKQQALLADIKTLVETINKPPQPPPGTVTTPTPGSQPPAGVTQQQVYEAAFSDKDKGNFDQAFNEFQDYLRWFPTGEYAPNSQFYIGEIFLYKKDYDGAVDAFNLLLEKYPGSNKAPDAMYLKARALMSNDKKNSALKTLDELIKTYPNTEAARKGRQLKASLAPAQKKKSRD
ncbi:MAG: tol-pal system protein YbgF [Acidobacteria bacterium]|nr:tol-pal system protein YbgF [Acidobacteriota bacterium]